VARTLWSWDLATPGVRTGFLEARSGSLRKLVANGNLKTLHPRGLLVARRNTILFRSRLGLLRFFHLPIRLDSPLPRQLATSHPCVCPYIRAVHSRLVQMQPEVGLAGPGAPVLGARGSLQYHAHRRALHRSALSASVSLFVR
jgi:hypothetical protein